MRLKIRTGSIVYVIYMIFIINVNYSLFYTNYAPMLQTLLALIAAYYVFVRRGIGRIEKCFIKEFNAFCTPMVLISLLSIFTAVFVHHTSNQSDINQSLVRCYYYVVAFMIAYFSVKKFGKDAPVLIITAGLISYATVFFQYIYYAGFDGLLHFMNNKVNGISLEVHNLTYCLGLFFLFYLLCDKYPKKYKIRMCIILGIAIFWGNKRALYFGFAITLVIYYLFHKFAEKRLTLLKVIFVVYIIGAFLYLWFVKSGIFELLLSIFNINDMSRLKFWNYFQNVYEITPFYWGRGISYTDNIMGLPSTMKEMQVTSATNIHNDILRAYIGWGCLPFLYYFINFFLIRTHRFIQEGNQKNGWRYFAVASFYYFVNFFDNMLTAVNFNLCFFVVFLLLENEDKKMRK